MKTVEDKIVSSIELKKILLDKAHPFIQIYFTSLPTLNRIIDGFVGGELTVISGSTKQGKTLLAQSFTNEFAKQGIKCLWFTYEVPPLQFLNQFGKELPLFYLPQTLTSNLLGWIKSKVEDGIIEQKISVVFIDHLHFLCDMDKSNISLEIGKVMRFLKKLAVTYNLCIFIIAHTGKTKLDKEPEANEIRDSSFITQESDNTFMIWRNKKEPNRATLKICLNRRLGVFNKNIKLIKQNNFLYEFTESDYEFFKEEV